MFSLLYFFTNYAKVLKNTAIDNNEILLMKTLVIFYGKLKTSRNSIMGERLQMKEKSLSFWRGSKTIFYKKLKETFDLSIKNKSFEKRVYFCYYFLFYLSFS